MLIVEKRNLVSVFKLVLKELIETALVGDKARKTIDKHSTHFISFFDVFEHILEHGLKSSSTN